MSLAEINQKVSELAKDWERFKSLNERKLKEIEQKGQADPLTQEQLNKINDSLDRQGEFLNKLSTKNYRPFADTNTQGGIYQRRIDRHKQAFRDYLRKGVEQNLLQLEAKSTDSEIGYSVTNSISSTINEKLLALSPLRQISNVTEISTDVLEVIEDKEESKSGWSGEDNNSLLNDGEQIHLSKRSIIAHELYAQPKATQKLLDDPRIDIEAWISRKLIDTFIQKENAAFIHGDGKGKPRGILSYQSGTSRQHIEQVSAPNHLNVESLLELFYSLKEKFALNAKFLMNRKTIQNLRLLKDSSGRYLWQPALAADAGDTLLGAEVLCSADMPTPEAGNIPIAVGDFKRSYQIVDRHNIRVMRDPFTHKPFIKFYATKHVGGDVVNFDAIKLLKLNK